MAFGGLRDAAADELAAFIGDIQLFAFIPRRIEVKLDAKRGGLHRRRQIFGEIRRFFVRRAEAVMLADVAVG